MNIPGLGNVLDEAPGPGEGPGHDVFGCTRVDIPCPPLGASALNHPWHTCELCGDVMKAWPHRSNHFAKRHPGFSPTHIDAEEEEEN